MSSEDDQYDRENYSLIIISLLDTDLEDNSKVTALVYLNGELDDTIKLKGSTTIFIHKQDVLTFEIKDQSPPQTIGIIEISTLQLLSESERIFQKWLPSAFNSKIHKILFEFEIQQMGTLNSSKLVRNQTQQNETDPYQQQKIQATKGQQYQIGSEKNTPIIQSAQLEKQNNQMNQDIHDQEEIKPNQMQSPQQNTQIQRQTAEYQTYLDNDLGQSKKSDKSKAQENYQEQFKQQNEKKGDQKNDQEKDNFTVSPIKVMEQSEIKRPGYQFQKLGQNNQLSLGENNPQGSIAKNIEGQEFQSGQVTNSTSPQGPNQGIFNAEQQQIYDLLEEELIKLAKKIQNKNFNSLIDKRRAQYLELKNLLKDISEQFETLKKHPCRSCEKKYIPSIQKGIQKIYSCYNLLMDQISQQQSVQNNQQQAQQQKQVPLNEFIQSLSESKKSLPFSSVNKQNLTSSRSKSPMTTKNQHNQHSQNLQNSQTKHGKNSSQGNNYIQSSQLAKQAYQMSPNNAKKVDKLKEEEQKIIDLQMNSNYIREQLENQFKRTNDLETENKQLKLRNFILEADLKNLLKRIQQEKLAFSTRATFKLQEFRFIFEYFHSLRLERESLLDEIHQLQDELNITQGDKKKNSGQSNNNSQRQSQHKSIRQTMNEYAKHKKDTLSSVEQEEQRIQNEIAQGKYSNSQYHAHNISKSLSPKPRDYLQSDLNLIQKSGDRYIPPMNSYTNRMDDNYSNINDVPQYKKYEDELQNEDRYLNSLMNNYKPITKQENPYHYIGNGNENGGQNQLSGSKTDFGSIYQQEGYDNKSKEYGPSSSTSARNEIHHLLNQRKSVINELLEKIGEI